MAPRILATLSLGALVSLGGCLWKDTSNPPPDTGIQVNTADQPVFGTTVSQAVPPPAISGGTLVVLSDGSTAVASDPDRDHIYVVDLNARAKIADIALSPGDEPGRVIEDGNGRVHVVLRSGGALVTLTPNPWQVSARRAICAAPRGVAWSSNGDQLYVACAGGELAMMPAAAGAPTHIFQLDDDLRDVVVRQGQIIVSRFHSAELITLDPLGKINAVDAPAQLQTQRFVSVPVDSQNQNQNESPSFEGDGSGNQQEESVTFSPNAAWRLAMVPGTDELYMLHQAGLDQQIVTSQPGGYGSFEDPCGSAIVHTTISDMTPGVARQPGLSFPNVVLPVDFAFTHSGNSVAILSAGNAHSALLPTVVFADTATLGDSGQCQDGFSNGSPTTGNSPSAGYEPIAVAYTGDDALVVQSREPAALLLPDTNEFIALSDVSKVDTGHAVFHSNSGAGLACASCHLEGGDDARTWTFEDSGARRTQSIRGGIMGTEPFHWDGDQANFGVLMTEVFGHRMSGPTLADDQLAAMKGWVNAIPAMPMHTVTDAAAVERGRALFQDTASVGCASCHSGPALTNNTTVDVGTGGKFQVPSLRGVAWRAPYLHDGRAGTLLNRFDPNVGGGDLHGHTSQLTTVQVNDLIAYLQTL